MTFYNPFTNLNMLNFTSGINLNFTPMFSCWNMPSFFNSSLFGNWNFPAMFDSLMPSSFNWNFTSPSVNSWQKSVASSSIFDFSLTDFSSLKHDYNWDNFQSSTNFTISSLWPDSSAKISNIPETGNPSLLSDLAVKAKSYVGKVNSDKEGNRLFSNGQKQAWCADFVTKVTKDTFGSKLPSSFGSSAVSELRNWGIQNNCYTEMPASEKAKFIADNVKVGDIMIEKEGGKSHTGIVTKVNKDGSFETVEGNCDDKVQTRSYTADSNTLSGFVSLEKYAV